MEEVKQASNGKIKDDMTLLVTKVGRQYREKVNIFLKLVNNPSKN